MSEGRPRRGSGTLDVPMQRLLGAVRRGWWIIGGTAVALVLATALVLLVIPPVYEAEGRLRIDPDRPGFRGLEAIPGFELVMGGGGASVPTELVVLRSRTLALEADGELGVRARIAQPRGVPRSLLFAELVPDPDLQEAEFRFVRQEDGYAVEARVREVPEVWRPFRIPGWVVAESARVVPGEPFHVAGLRGRLRDDAADRAREIRVQVLPEEDYLESYERSLTVERSQRDADVVEVRFRDPDPRLARDVVNLLQGRFMADRREQRSREPRDQARLLAERLGILQVELEEAEEQLRDYRERRRVIAPEVEAEEEIVRLAEIAGTRDVAEAERRALSELVDQIRTEEEAREAGEPSPWRRLVAFPTLLQLPTTANLLQSLNQLENERSALLETRLDEDLRVSLVTDRIQAVERQLQGVVETYLDGLGRQIASLDRTLDGYRSELDRIPVVEMEYVRHRRQVELLSEVLVVLETRQREAEIRALVQDASIQVVDEARLPGEPASPRPLLSLALSFLVGLALGTGGALVREGI